MEKLTKVNDNLCIEELNDGNKTITSIIVNGKKKELTNIKPSNYFFSNVIYDENYIVVYSRGCMMNQIPLDIEAAYDIKNNKMLDITDEEIVRKLKYIYICKQNIHITNILTFINKEELSILEVSKRGYLKHYLTGGNNNISDEEVIDYIIKQYPIFSNYRNIKGPLTFLGYKELCDEIDDSESHYFSFHMMSKSLELVNTNYLENIGTTRTLKK